MDDRPPYQLLTSTRYDLYLKSLGWNDDNEGPLPFFLLQFHLDRLISAAEIHGWTDVQSSLTYPKLKTLCFEAVSLQKDSDAFKVLVIPLRPSIGTYNAQCLIQIRITVSEKGEIQVAASPLPTRFQSDPTSLSLFHPFFHSQNPPISLVRIYVDRLPTKPSIFTRTKTTFRQFYDHIKIRNQSILSSPLDSSSDSDVLMYNQDGEITETTVFNVAFYRNSQWSTPPTTTGCLPGVMRRSLLESGRIHEDGLNVLKKDSVHRDEWVLLFNGVQGCRLGRLQNDGFTVSSSE
jgi:4-amino-4-deoxychorismate lyase